MTRIRSRALLLFGLSSSLTSLAMSDTTFATTTPPDEPSVRESPPGTSSTSDLDALLVDALGEQDGGIAVLSIRDDETTTAVAGVANVAGDPIAADTPFRVASISKPFVATMILQLVDEGSVDLDEALSTYLPSATIGGDVPIRMLLNHSSGLRNYTDRSAFIPDVFEDRNRVFTPDEILAWVEGTVTDEPGQHFAYSNTNYILLGQLIERVTGTDLDTARNSGSANLSDSTPPASLPWRPQPRWPRRAVVIRGVSR